MLVGVIESSELGKQSLAGVILTIPSVIRLQLFDVVIDSFGKPQERAEAAAASGAAAVKWAKEHPEEAAANAAAGAAASARKAAERAAFEQPDADPPSPME